MKSAEASSAGIEFEFFEDAPPVRKIPKFLFPM
jgi:hypothetical protein